MARVKLDRAGMNHLAKVQSRKLVEETTERIADNVRRMNLQTSDGPLPVETDVVTTDRAHGLVTLAHPAGEPMQAKYGPLTKAAAQAGLQVKGKDR